MIYTIYLKLTNNCNLNCAHCYNACLKKIDMTYEILNMSIQAILKFQKEHPDDFIDIQLHGGEPMLFDNNIIYDILSKNIWGNKIRFGMTTNLIYKISDLQLNIFKLIKPDNKKSYITTSWDYKIRFKNKDQENLWEKNIKLLKSNKIEVQPIITLTDILIKDIKPDFLIKYFKSLNISNINFERVTETGNAKFNKLRPNNRDVDDWLFQFYLKVKENNLSVPLFQSVEASLKRFYLGCRARLCTKTVITINPDGTICGCPNTVDFIFGHIKNSEFQIDHKKRDLIFCCEQKKNINCLLCDIYQYCNGDCFQLRYDETGCPGLKKIYNLILKSGELYT